MASTLEVCIDNRFGLDHCIKGGADRIELCSALPLGGLTPSFGLMHAASKVAIPVFAMIRPRDGDFCFGQSEVEVMLQDINAAKSVNLAGVVLGASTSSNKLDLGVLGQLCAAAEGMGRTLHRVIDTISDPFEAIDQACDLGFERILTSGGALNASSATDRLKAMQQHANGRIEIMAGSGITVENASEIMAKTGLTSFHASCSVAVSISDSLSRFGFAGSEIRNTDAATIGRLKQAIS